MILGQKVLMKLHVSYSLLDTTCTSFYCSYGSTPGSYSWQFDFSEPRTSSLWTGGDVWFVIVCSPRGTGCFCPQWTSSEGVDSSHVGVATRLDCILHTKVYINNSNHTPNVEF